MHCDYKTVIFIELLKSLLKIANDVGQSGTESAAAPNVQQWYRCQIYFWNVRKDTLDA